MIKKIIQLALFLSALMFSGCGSGDVTGDSNNTQIVRAGDIYSLTTGDTIKQNDDNTTISITHTIETGTKIVEVLTGSITIVKGNY
ncbi:MAG: hypothetical protein PHF17_04715 [Arcobacteraceae bacterium]|nr:hypothetical protein [Arcobacteraceae bacterium]